MKKLFLIAIPLFSLLVSCKVDFSPNAEWKDVPVVWCLLDQYDDTVWVRVQRCYVGNDNLYNYTQVSDSIYYPQDAITVTLEKWKAQADRNGIFTITGDAPVDKKDLGCMMVNVKDSGLFASGSQPAYFFPNPPYSETNNRHRWIESSWGNDKYMYKLVVRNNQSNEIIATATTQLVGGLVEDGLDPQSLERPNVDVPKYRMFRFSNGECVIEWKPFVAARLYQPVVRFYYYHGYYNENNQFQYDKTRKYYVDVNVPSASQSGTSSTVSTTLGESYFLLSVKDAIQSAGDDSQKGFCDTVDIMLNICNEDLNAYLKSTTPSNTIVQNHVLYTNINDGDGVGIFASRRTPHTLSDDSKILIFRLPSDPQTGPGTYHDKLKNLGVGF